MTDTTDYMRSRIIAHLDQPDVYDPPTREDMYDRILSDAETIKAASDLAHVPTCATTAAAYRSGDLIPRDAITPAMAAEVLLTSGTFQDPVVIAALTAIKETDDDEV